MPKKNTNTKEIKNEKTKFKDLIFNPTNIYLLICLIIVCALFAPTLNRPWLTYDERIIYDSIYFIIPSSFSEIFELIEKFSGQFNIISSNSYYSSNYLIRTCPLSLVLNLFAGFFLGKNAFLFHSLNLILHLFNTCLFFFILKYLLQTSNSLNKKWSNFLLTLSTITWAIHPIMVESVLLSTNFGATLSYSFFFSFLLDFLVNREKNNSLIRGFLIPVIFLIPMLANEYIVALPFILFIISLYESFKNHPFKKAFNNSLSETKSYFFGLILYLIFYSVFSSYRVISPINENQLVVFIERIFWLAPQIFIHFLKLVFYPAILSTDQTSFVHLGKTLFSPYAILCIVIFASWLFIPLYVFLTKKKISKIFLLSWTFFFSLLPFLHILTQSYLLAAERYLYIPLALLIFGIFKILLDKIENKKIFISSLLILTIISLACFTRSYFRTLDWKDNYSFITSTYNSTTSPLLKAIKLNLLSETIDIIDPKQISLLKDYYDEILKLLNKSTKENLALKAKFQDSLPAVIKAYGLDYESALAKTASIEATLRCFQLKEDHRIGIELLQPYINKPELLDPRIFQIYSSWLIQDKEIAKAKNTLLKANSTYPYVSPILTLLFDITKQYENNRKDAEKYLKEALKFYPFDTSILVRAVTFYEEQGNYFLVGRYSYLYGLLTHSKVAYDKALLNYSEVGAIRDGRITVNKLLKLAPNDPESLYYISDFYYKSNNKKQALTYLLKAYSIGLQKSSSPELLFNIGYTLSKLLLDLGNKEQAIALAKEIFTFAENDNKSLTRLARLYKSLDLQENFNVCLKKIKLQAI